MKVEFRQVDGVVPFDQVLEKLRDGTIRNATVKFETSGQNNVLSYSVEAEFENSLCCEMIGLKEIKPNNR